MKICKQCKLAKPPIQFHSNGRGLLDSFCRVCRCAKEREDYERALSPDQRERLYQHRAARALFPEEKRERQREWSRKLSKARRQMTINSKRGKPCHDCGGVFHPDAMDFDHRDPSTKVANISELQVLGRRRKLAAEMAKCDLVCSNCHRVRTARRRAGLPATLPEPEFFI
jgi:hypothetical protein